MTIEVHPIDLKSLPFEPGTNQPTERIFIQSLPDEHMIADGESGPFDWIDLRDVQGDLSRLIDAEQRVLEAAEATLVLSYPLEVAATRRIRPSDDRVFKRGELVKMIDETYREVYRREASTQSTPTPPKEHRGRLLNRPESDGLCGISGHDLEDLGIESIDVYRIDDHVWLDLNVCS